MTNWGIVGAGAWVDRFHLPVLKQLADEKRVRLRSIWNRSQDKSEKLAKKYGIEQVCESFEDLLNDDLIDCITVVLEKNVCSSYIKRIAESRIPFLAEKPPAESYLVARSLCQSIGRLPHLIGFNRRYVPIVRFAEKILPKKIVGYHFNMWRKDRQDSRYIYETGIHAVNLTEYFFGPVVQVQILRKWFTETGRPSILLKLTHESCEGFIDFRCRAGCSQEQVMFFSPDKIVELSLCLPFVNDEEAKLRVFENGEWKNHLKNTKRVDEYKSYGFRNEYEEMLRSIESNIQTASTIESTLSSLRIAEWSEAASSGDILRL